MNGDQGKAYFRLVYDKATGWFTVYDEHDEDITDHLQGSGVYGWVNTSDIK